MVILSFIVGAAAITEVDVSCHAVIVMPADKRSDSLCMVGATTSSHACITQFNLRFSTEGIGVCPAKIIVSHPKKG